MLIKFIGMVLIVSGFGGWGMSGAHRLRGRVKHLRDLHMALGYLEKEITCMYNPLSQALENTAHFSPLPVARLFSATANVLRDKSGVTAREAWLQGIAQLQPVAQLLDSDYELLAAAAHQLGASDAAQQRKFLNTLQEQLKITEEKARQNMESGQKLWTYGGFLAGLLVVLLLI
ncbi:MAG TPA: hypothetical protein VN426_03645 [Syntrophomonadaceae bacterium]|nr:hypothetical protein [Syntrophomonadaceae bacterium]